MTKRLKRGQHRGKGTTRHDIILFLISNPNGKTENEIREYLEEKFNIRELKGIRKLLDNLKELGVITKKGNLYKVKSSFSKKFIKEIKRFFEEPEKCLEEVYSSFSEKEKLKHDMLIYEGCILILREALIRIMRKHPEILLEIEREYKPENFKLLTNILLSFTKKSS